MKPFKISLDWRVIFQKKSEENNHIVRLLKGGCQHRPSQIAVAKYLVMLYLADKKVNARG